MGDIIEGIIGQLSNWKSGKGMDITLLNDAYKYFYHGTKFPQPVGVPLRMEIIKGEGEHSDKWEILNVQLIETNTNPHIIPPLSSNIAQTPQNIAMPIEAFKQLMDKRQAVNQGRIEALRNAVNLYACLRMRDTDPTAAARDVKRIAEELESFLT